MDFFVEIEYSVSVDKYVRVILTLSKFVCIHQICQHVKHFCFCKLNTTVNCQRLLMIETVFVCLLTGRHYHGSEKDPKRWKPNFRCALNSLKTVKPLEKSLKGSNAFRLFQILAFSGNKSYVKKEGNIREQRASKGKQFK